MPGREDIFAITLKGVPTEVSFHECPKRMAKELPNIFGADAVADKDIVVVAVYQRAAMDLVSVGADVEQEKDRLLEQFNAIVRHACATLAESGFWADFTDPCSGYPALGERHKGIFPDVQGAQALMKYDTGNAGCCQVLSHPQWGTRVSIANMVVVVVMTTAAAAAAAAAVMVRDLERRERSW